MTKFKEWFNKPADGIELIILLVVCFLLVMQASGCNTFIGGIIRSDILEAKISHPAPIRANWSAGAD